MSALIGNAKAMRALAVELEDQAQSAARYPEEKAAGVPDILHRMALANMNAASEIEDMAKAEASG
jgi:hypothetical protein